MEHIACQIKENWVIYCFSKDFLLKETQNLLYSNNKDNQQGNVWDK